VIEKAEQIERIRKLVSEKSYNNFFGELTIRMEHGNVIWVEEAESFREPLADATRRMSELGDAVEGSIRKLQTRDGEEVALVYVRKRGKLWQMVPVEEDAEPPVVAEG